MNEIKRKMNYYNSFKHSLNWAKRTLNDALFPWGKCLLCGGSLDGDYYVCSHCLRQLGDYKRCESCGCFLSLAEGREHSLVCPYCLGGNSNYIDEYYSVLPYNGNARELLLDLKYNDKSRYARPFAQYLADSLLGRLPHQGRATEILAADFIVDVPLHANRLKERGYNQAALLASALAEDINLPYLPNALQRHKETKIQHRLSAKERRENTADAFSAGKNGGRVQGKTVILVDDILTSGSTLDNCAKVLKKLGAQRVYGVTVASALIKL